MKLTILSFFRVNLRLSAVNENDYYLSSWLFVFFVVERLFEKTKPIYSYCVMLDAYCVKGFEKTKPMSKRVKWH